ncbi:MAG: response regulator transcription factor [Synergistaceae bacterium]|nr:response regulator transcription factor [Synergistaceae bacterium]
MIRILLADDHPLTRSGLAAWIEKEEGMELVALAEDGEAAWLALNELLPDLALLDIEMPGGNGIDLASRITKQGLKTNVLMLTAYSAQQYVMASVRAGAKGFILKSAPLEELRRAVFDTAQGIFYLDPSVSLVRDDEPAEELSPREREVLVLAGQGMPASEVAALLSITERTVAAHLTSIYSKLSARNKTEAILLALKKGIVLLEELQLLDEKRTEQ